MHIAKSRVSDARVSCNLIRGLDPQCMILTMVEVQHKRFMERKIAAMACPSSVPPNTERILAQLILKSRPFQSSVSFFEGTDMMKATVLSKTDASLIRRVVVSTVP